MLIDLREKGMAGERERENVRENIDWLPVKCALTKPQPRHMP